VLQGLLLWHKNRLAFFTRPMSEQLVDKEGNKFLSDTYNHRRFMQPELFEKKL
jgi:hypothetical protein